MSKPEFENQVSISAVTNKKIKYVTKEINGVGLNQNVFERHTFFSPPKTVSRIINMQMFWDRIVASGLTGEREFILDNYLSPTLGLGIFRAVSTDTTRVFTFDQGAFKMDDLTTGVTFVPNDLSAINYNIREMRFDETIGLTFIFRHTLANAGTGINVTENRRIIFFTEEEVVDR